MMIYARFKVEVARPFLGIHKDDLTCAEKTIVKLLIQEGVLKYNEHEELIKGERFEK